MLTRLRSAYIFIILAGLICTSSIEPVMSPRDEKVQWMTFAVLSVVVNTLAWQMMKGQPSEGSSVSRAVEYFVQEQLIAIDLKNPASIKVRSHKTIFFAASHNTIYIRED